MTDRLTIAMHLLAGYAANPAATKSIEHKDIIATTLDVADALLAAAEKPAATGAPCESWYVAEGVRCQLSAGHQSPHRYEGATPGDVMTWPTPAEKPAEAAPLTGNPSAHMHDSLATAAVCSTCRGTPSPVVWTDEARDFKPGDVERLAEVVRAHGSAPLPSIQPAPVAPLPWVVRWVASKKEIARCDAESDARTLRDLYVTSAVEVAAAPTVAAVKFGHADVATGAGWHVKWCRGDNLNPPCVVVQIDLRPGEDAGETVAKMLAAVGRGP